jgi:hypothetical protein
VTAGDGGRPGTRRELRRQDGDTGRRGSLLAAEVSRLVSRRFVRWLVVLALVGLVVSVGYAFTQFAKPSAAGLAEANAQLKQVLIEADRARAECAKSIPAGQTVETYCGPPAAEQGLTADQFIAKQPFDLAQYAPIGAVAVASGAAALAFLVGATFVGAEWSTRSIVALLFWEPRRVRVMAVKIAVTAGFAALAGALAQLLWVGAAVLLARTRGTTKVEPGFWGDLLAQQGRSVALAVVAALFGFGIATLIRGTGAALGVGFLYFAVIETAVRSVWNAGQQFLITTNAAGLLAKGGTKVYLAYETVDERGIVQPGRELLIGNGRAGLTLAIYCGLLLAAGVWSFQRRDLQ